MDESLENIAKFVYQRSRILFSERRMILLRNRVEVRMQQLKLPDFAAYQAYLFRSPGEESALLDILTTKETFFFRNPGQFRYLAEKIIPAMEAEKGKEAVNAWAREKQAVTAPPMKLRILCAGCATGEEPYSVAMSLLESLRYPKAWDIEILAGDISTSCLETGTTAYYRSERLKEIPAPYLDKYMEMTDDGAVFTNEVKKLVKFCRLNLKDIIIGGKFPSAAAEFSGFDIIFCRNVMIYFSAEAQQQLVDALFRTLMPGGYLFTGDAEALHPFRHDFQSVKDAGCLIYRKPV